MLAFFHFLFLVQFLVALTDPTCDKNMGMDWYLPVGDKLPDNRITASSERPFYKARYGRFRSPVRGRMFGVWCPEARDNKHPWFQVDLVAMKTITAVAIGCTEYGRGYVKKFTVHYSYDGEVWFLVKEKRTNETKTFSGLDDYWDKRKEYLDVPVTGQFFRIYPVESEGVPCLQAEFFGCAPNKDCNKAVGVSNSEIVTDNQLTSSSFFNKHPAHSGRLNATMQPIQGQWGAWCATSKDRNPWFQIDMKDVRELSKVETQGHPSRIMGSWVTKYALNYSLNGVDWRSYNNYTVLNGSIDKNTIKANVLENTILAQYLRILPKEWEGEIPCLRVELFECIPRKASIPKLVIGLSKRVIKRGESMTMSCLFRGQPNMTIIWSVNGHYLRMDKRVNTNELIKDSEASSTLFIKRVKASESNAVFACKAWYPKLEKIHAKSIALVTVLAPEPSLTIVNISAIQSFIYLNFTGPRTRDALGYLVQISSTDGIRNLQISLNQSSLVKVSELRPYMAYQLQVAMVYLENELSGFRSKQTINTPQDRPYGAPLDLKVTKVSHDTLLATWQNPAVKLQNGPIIFHEIRYMKSNESDSSKSNSRNNQFSIEKILETSLYLKKLEPGAIYEVSVRSYTKVGPGPWVHPPVLIFTGKATEELNSLKKMVITDSNAAAVSNRLKNITADPNFLNKHDVVLTLDILEKVVDKRGSNDEIGKSLVEAVSNVLKANKTVLSESEITNRTGTRYVKMLEKWLEGVDIKDKKLEEESENVVVKKVFLNKLKIEEGIQFAKEDHDHSVEITIPKEAVPENSTADSVYFVFYKKNKFFTGKKRLQEFCLNGFTVIKERVYTPVVSGEVIGQTTRNLSAPVVLKFKHNEDVTKLKQTACAYWDYQADNAKGGWSTDGCQVESIINNTITCHCNHLTNFAAMMDVYAQTSTICGKHQKIISFITVIGCFLSLIGLFLTFLTYFIFRKLLKEMAAKVLIQLCVALFIVILTFVTGIEQTDKPMMCMTVAFILHYFTLVSFFWMMMEASFMYHAFVKVWPPRQGGDIYKSTIVAWGIPLFIVGITFLTSMDSYGGTHYCHLTGTPLIAAYLAPIGLIILINFIIFLFIMRRLSARPNSNSDQNNLQIATERLRRAFGIMILMGLTWAFGFGSVSDARLEFSYLFSIFNASQGFAIFIFYCVAQKRARSQWYAFFTCDGRTENKRLTDSYYSERRRLSSIASNRTNTMQFNRVNSNASSVLISSGSISNGYALPPPDKYTSPMHTIEEIESPIRHFDDEEPPVCPLIDLATSPEPDNPLLGNIEDVDGGTNEESFEEDDELLNKKLQNEQVHRQVSNVKHYSSYRALSGSKSYDVLNLVTTPSAKYIGNNTMQRSSVNDVTIRSGSQNAKSGNNRRSLIDTSTNRIHFSTPRVRSMEQINKNDLADIPKCDIDLIAYKKVNANDKVLSKNELGDQEKTTKEAQGVRDIQTHSIDTGTLKSDAATMTEDVIRPPSYDGKPQRHNKEIAQNDVMTWLENCENESELKDSDSDYSSSFYKTSRSSSMTDVGRLYTANTSDYMDDVRQNGCLGKSPEKELLENMILGPLKGTGYNISNHQCNNQNDGGHNTRERFSDFSEDGYSPSEDEITNENKLNNRPVRRKKSRNRNMMNLKKPVNGGYMTLDNPSEHSSYV